MKTFTARPAEIEREWLLIDAEGQVLGRLASTVAMLLRGKHKPIYTPHVDTGDHVVIINAAKVRLTGRKLQNKVKYRHSGYPGGLKATKIEKLMQTRPESVIRDAVRGMLPKNPLGRRMLGKLKVYPGSDHPHQAQKPRRVEITPLKTVR
jgi:large subunit ribosomal protein L13